MNSRKDNTDEEEKNNNKDVHKKEKNDNHTYIHTYTFICCLIRCVYLGEVTSK